MTKVLENRWGKGSEEYHKFDDANQNNWGGVEADLENIKDITDNKEKEPNGRILDESLPHFKFEYLQVKNCTFYRIRHYYNVPNDYVTNHIFHVNPIKLTPKEFMDGLRWGYIDGIKTSVKNIKENFQFDQGIEQAGNGSFSTNLLLKYRKGEITVTYNFFAVADQLIITSDKGALISTPMETTDGYKTISQKFDFDEAPNLFIAISHAPETLPNATDWELKITATYEIETVDEPNFKNEYSDPWDCQEQFYAGLLEFQPQELPIECQPKKHK
jgi:hypothetical protein